MTKGSRGALRGALLAAALIALAPALAAALAPPAHAAGFRPAIDAPDGAAAPVALLPEGAILEVEVAIAFGLDERGLDESLSIQSRLTIEVLEVRGGYLVIDAAVEVLRVRHLGPEIAFEVRPARGARPAALDTPAGQRDGGSLRQPRPSNAKALDLLRRQRAVAVAALRLHDTSVRAVLAQGPEPWVSISERSGKAAIRTPPGEAIARELLLRGMLLAAFPPIPGADAEAKGEFEASEVPHRVYALATTLAPVTGRELRVEALRPTAFARALYRYEALNDLGFVPASSELHATERARVHPDLGVAAWRSVATRSRLQPEEGRAISALASWRAWLASVHLPADDND